MINFPFFYLHMQMSSDSEHLCPPHSEKTTFQTDLKTRIEVLNAALDTQILQLDPNAADYDMQKQVLEDRKTQLLRIPS